MNLYVHDMLAAVFNCSYNDGILSGIPGGGLVKRE